MAEGLRNLTDEEAEQLNAGDVVASYYPGPIVVAPTHTRCFPIPALRLPEPQAEGLKAENEQLRADNQALLRWQKDSLWMRQAPEDTLLCALRDIREGRFNVEQRALLAKALERSNRDDGALHEALRRPRAPLKPWEGPR